MKTSYIHLPEGGVPPPTCFDGPFTAIVVTTRAVDAKWRASISEWLVRNGCLYLVAWGPDSTAWDDSVDLANLKAFNFEDIPGDKFVMTTWHPEETLADAFWFARWVAIHPTVTLTEIFILDINPANRQLEMLEAFQAAA